MFRKQPKLTCYVFLSFCLSAAIYAGSDWVEVVTQSDYNNYQRILDISSQNDDWAQIFGCRSSPYSIQMLYKRNKEFVGLLKCMGGLIWVSSIGTSSVGVKINAPLDLKLPTTTLSTTTVPTTVPVTTTPFVTDPPAPPTTTAMTQTRSYTTTSSENLSKSLVALAASSKLNAKNPTESSVPSSKSGNNQVAASGPMGGNSGSFSSLASTISVIPTTLPRTTLSPSDQFSVMLAQSSSPIQSACKQWNVLESKSLNAGTVSSNVNLPRKIYKAQCKDDVLPVTLYFTFDALNGDSFKKSGNLLTYKLTSYNESQGGLNASISAFPSPYWQELRQDVLQYLATGYPKGVTDIVGKQCSGQNVNWVSLYSNANNATTIYTKVICSITLQTQLYISSYTPEEADPILIGIYVDRPYYVEEVYRSVFSIYRTVNRKSDEMARVVRDLKLMQNSITSKLIILGCNSKTYTTLAVHGDPKQTSKSYFVEITCKNKRYYIEYEKPDDAKTQTTLETMDYTPIDLSGAQNLPHKGWDMSFATFDSKSLLKSTVNFAEAAKRVNCSDYWVVLTYEKIIMAKQQKYYLVAIYCPSNESNPVAYVTVFTLLKSDWFKPCLADNIRFYPPEDF